jgi:hypothetical protein
MTIADDRATATTFNSRPQPPQCSDMDVDQPRSNTESGDELPASVVNPRIPSTQGTVVCHYEGVVSPPLRKAATVSTTLTFGMTMPWQPSDVAQGKIVEVPEHFDELPTPPEHVSTPQKTQPTSSLITGLSRGVTRMNLGLGVAAESLHPRGNTFTLRSPPFGRKTSNLGQSAAASSSRTVDPPSRSSVSSQQPTVPDERSPHVSQMDVDHSSPSRVSTPPPAAASFSIPSPPIPEQSEPQHAGGPPLSPTTPTPVGAGRQRWRSRTSYTFGQEIPQMLGDMKDVIGDLAASVNGLKDVVSDLRAGQGIPGGFGSTSARSSGRRGSGRGRSSGGQRGGERGRGTGGPVGDDYTADDEGQEDEDQREPKNPQLRVSAVTHI